MLILGLPGNPVSAIVCGVLFLLPLVRALNGEAQPDAETSESAILGAPLRGNDSRQDFLRATLRINESGVPVATPLSAQDSSLLRVMAQAQCLVVRMPQAQEAKAGDPCRIIRLPKAGM
jgi:molybdopterin molybdotransferase